MTMLSFSSSTSVVVIVVTEVHVEKMLMLQGEDDILYIILMLILYHVYYLCRDGMCVCAQGDRRLVSEVPCSETFSVDRYHNLNCTQSILVLCSFCEYSGRSSLGLLGN